MCCTLQLLSVQVEQLGKEEATILARQAVSLGAYCTVNPWLLCLLTSSCPHAASLPQELKKILYGRFGSNINLEEK